MCTDSIIDMAEQAPSAAMHDFEEDGAGAGAAVAYWARKGDGLVLN